MDLGTPQVKDPLKDNVSVVEVVVVVVLVFGNDTAQLTERTPAFTCFTSIKDCPVMCNLYNNDL